MNFYARSGLLRECIGEFLTDISGPVDIRLEADGFLGGPDGGEHGRKDGIAILKGDDPVSFPQGRPEQLAHRSSELGICDRVQRNDPVLDLFLTRGEVEDQNDEDSGPDNQTYDQALPRFPHHATAEQPSNRHAAVVLITERETSQV
ncbi:MAG: hypothetical protein ABIQ65_03220 [Thermoanaerobaculia bacterium]